MTLHIINRKNVLMDIHDDERQVSRNATTDRTLFTVLVSELFTDFQFSRTRNKFLKNNVALSLFDTQHDLNRNTIIQATYKKHFEVIR